MGSYHHCRLNFGENATEVLGGKESYDVAHQATTSPEVKLPWTSISAKNAVCNLLANDIKSKKASDLEWVQFVWDCPVYYIPKPTRNLKFTRHTNNGHNNFLVMFMLEGMQGVLK